MPKPAWSRKLSRPIRVKGGPTLLTLKDAAAFMLDLPTAGRPSWQHAAKMAMAAATGNGSIEDASMAIETALFLEARWLPEK